jgi:ABC-type glycerol-3-phosphate transport system permease component
MAGGALAAIPTILFFLMFQRHFVAGLRVGAVKS